MGRNRYQPKNPEPKPNYETEEYEEVVQIDDKFNPNYNASTTKHQLENMNDLFRKSYANLDEIKSKLENLEHYSSKLCLTGDTPSPCPFSHQFRSDRYQTCDNNEAYYHTEARPQYTNISHQQPQYDERDTELDKADVIVNSDPSDQQSNAIPSERIIIDLTPQNVDGGGGVTIKHTSGKYAYSPHQKYNNPPKSYKNPNEATFYVMNDNNPPVQPRRRIAPVQPQQPRYNQSHYHDINDNYNTNYSQPPQSHPHPYSQPPQSHSHSYSQPPQSHSPPPPPSTTNKKKKKKSSLNCCKKR